MKKIAILGGGSTAVFTASFLDGDKYDITIYEKTSRLGRKFLVAGHGGLNLSQDTDLDSLKLAYRPSQFMDDCLDLFDNKSLVAYLKSLGIETFSGSSGKIFPKDLKPAEVLSTIVDSLKNVNIETNATFDGFHNDTPTINGMAIEADIYIFALGGASWSKTGSNGQWKVLFEQQGIKTEPFRPSNCGWNVEWNTNTKTHLSYKPLKNIVVKTPSTSVKGEVMITDYGIEGGAVYKSTKGIKGIINNGAQAEVFLDLKPDTSFEEVKQALINRKKSITSTLNNVLKLEQEKVDLLYHTLSKEEFSSVDILTSAIKNFSVIITGFAPIDDAISTTGGINLTEIDSNFRLLKYPNMFCIGEMLDYDTVTGGYLLQSCASMAYHVSQTIDQV